LLLFNSSPKRKAKNLHVCNDNVVGTMTYSSPFFETASHLDGDVNKLLRNANFEMINI